MDRDKEQLITDAVNERLDQILANEYKTVGQLIGEYMVNRPILVKTLESQGHEQSFRQRMLEIYDDSLEIFSKYPGELLIRDLPLEELREGIKKVTIKFLKLNEE